MCLGLFFYFIFLSISAAHINFCSRFFPDRYPGVGSSRFICFDWWYTHTKLMYQPSTFFSSIYVSTMRAVLNTRGAEAQDDGANPGGTNLEDQLLSLVVMAKGKYISSHFSTYISFISACIYIYVYMFFSIVCCMLYSSYLRHRSCNFRFPMNRNRGWSVGRGLEGCWRLCYWLAICSRLAVVYTSGFLEEGLANQKVYLYTCVEVRRREIVGGHGDGRGRDCQ